MLSKFCPQCGAERLSNEARFCVECANPFPDSSEMPEDPPRLPATGATVRLTNATGEQSVLGGTIKLISAEAIPPGMWTIDDPPRSNDIVAVYVPLRAVVDGWSGQIETGWTLAEQLAPLADSTAPRFRFETTCSWFPARGYGRGMRLQVVVSAEAEAQEGRTRRGFRYRSNYDPPMTVRAAWWLNDKGTWVEQPLPEIQLMAPPRTLRISDVSETIRSLPMAEAQTWAKRGIVHEPLHLLGTRQQRTPAGRGLVLGMAQPGLLRRFFSPVGNYYIQLQRPLACTVNEWLQRHHQIDREASELGLGLSTDATIEWWLEQNSYDGMILDNVDPDRYQGFKRIVIAFRRAQLVKMR
jgi:hypothetical protein